MSVSKRLYRVFKTLTSEQLESFGDYLNQGNQYIDDLLSDWEETQRDTRRTNSNTDQNAGFKQTSQAKSETNSDSYNAFPEEVVNDLQLFGLTPPSTIDVVKKARNKEIKKYHPDHFNNDKNKQDTAKQIMQIYNSAFERLKKYYGK